ncbi:hypothetical protein DFH08DRAFT_823887 [Mycena albidolilacea]|uniref:Uncharacterized protein n=1 Tax=Mycena albidolilacea TaxID=1033008 RepID=A0AAD6Z5L8_9AGAR|nr:hypothetical protein DFH08DRAFT_823887 [Mycena albidolilacea]
MTFPVKDSIGCLPPPQGIQLYMARIDPHLTFGCEVALDVTNTHVSKLEDVQNEFLRRLLGLHRHSVLAVLFSEAGVIPLRYRQLSLAIETLYGSPRKASRAGSDLCFALIYLPVPILLSMDTLIPDGITDLKRRLTRSCSTWIGEQIISMSGRLPLIQGFQPSSMKLRLYLRVPVPAHRKALTRILLSSHSLAVELLYYQERLRAPYPDTQGSVGCVSGKWRVVKWWNEESIRSIQLTHLISVDLGTVIPIESLSVMPQPTKVETKPDFIYTAEGLAASLAFEDEPHIDTMALFQDQESYEADLTDRSLGDF